MNRNDNLQSNSVITNRLGLAEFVRYNREFVVSEFVNVVNMDFGTEKMGKICSLYPGVRYNRVCYNRVCYNRV
jgi:hypothetical protein